MSDVKTDTAKVFWSGRSQAVRLPKEYRFDTDEVTIRREGGTVVLEPVKQEADEWAWLDTLEPFDDDMVKAALDRPQDFGPGRRDADIKFPE